MALFPFASTNIGLQASVPDDHTAAGDYGFMSAFTLATIGLGVLASLRADGWRLTASNAGLLPVLVGATSLIYPGAMSSRALPWALAAIAWGAVFVAVAQLSPAGSAPPARRPAEPGRSPTGHEPAWHSPRR
ncbi:MAG TPA: hypothetical protein VG455_11970 [Acidimicrobiales bacterium]|nr:hypothetical protein [Acidimicrobiales bacterium]